MSSERRKSYHRQYMKKYYHNHKDYWRDYYLQKKGSSIKQLPKKSYQTRRSYLTRINVAWYKTKIRKSRLSRIIKRFGTRTFYSRQQIEKTYKNTEHFNQFRRAVLEILEIENFHSIRFPQPIMEENVQGDILSQAFALKDNKRCVIEFSTSPSKIFTKKRKEYLRNFLDFFEARYFLCFIKPDLTKYLLLELESSTIRSVSLSLKVIAAMKKSPKAT